MPLSPLTKKKLSSYCHIKKKEKFEVLTDDNVLFYPFSVFLRFILFTVMFGDRFTLIFGLMLCFIY